MSGTFQSILYVLAHLIFTKLYVLDTITIPTLQTEKQMYINVK